MSELKTENISPQPHILIVDDEPSLTSLIQRDFQRRGLKVTVVNDPLAALELFSSGKTDIDLVITDDAMPMMTGIEMSDKLLQQFPDLPIILITGYTILNLEHIAALGIKHFFQKPVELEELYQTVMKTLD